MAGWGQGAYAGRSPPVVDAPELVNTCNKGLNDSIWRYSGSPCKSEDTHGCADFTGQYVGQLKISQMAAGWEEWRSLMRSSEVKASPQASSLVKLLHGRRHVRRLSCSVTAYVPAAEAVNTHTRCKMPVMNKQAQLCRDMELVSRQ